MPDTRFPASMPPRFNRRPPQRRPRPEERAEPRTDGTAEGAAHAQGPWPLWSTVLPESADARVATGPLHGPEPTPDPKLPTTLFRTWVNGPCKTVYCCAIEGTPADGVLTLGPDGKETAKTLEVLAHDVMTAVNGAGRQPQTFRIQTLAVEPDAMRQGILDAVLQAPWSSGICFLYDPQVARSDVLAGLGLTFGAPAAAPAKADDDAGAAPEA